jgi:hypothetical protein
MSRVSQSGVPSAPVLPEPGRYRHFKGSEYEVLSVARHTETGDLVVVYCPVHDPDTVWVRPLEMFTGSVERPDGEHPRFEPTSTGAASGPPSAPLVWPTIRALGWLVARLQPGRGRCSRP